MSHYVDLHVLLAKAQESPGLAADLVARVEAALAELPAGDGERARRAELEALLESARAVERGFSGRDVEPLAGEDTQELEDRVAQAGGTGDTLKIELGRPLEELLAPRGR